MRTPVRRRMMLEMAEFYDRLAGGRNSRPAGRHPVARHAHLSLQREARCRLNARGRWVWRGLPSGLRGDPGGPHDPTRECAMCEGHWRAGTLVGEVIATLQG